MSVNRKVILNYNNNNKNVIYIIISKSYWLTQTISLSYNVSIMQK